MMGHIIFANRECASGGEVTYPALFGPVELAAQSRVAAFQTKADKDVRQAGALLELLFEDRPGDVRRALHALVQRGWQRTLT